MAETMAAIFGPLAMVLIVLAGMEALPWQQEKITVDDDSRLKALQERIRSTSFWFSEDLPTMMLVRDWAEEHHSSDTLREEWRKRRKENKQ